MYNDHKKFLSWAELVKKTAESSLKTFTKVINLFIQNKCDYFFKLKDHSCSCKFLMNKLNYKGE